MVGQERGFISPQFGALAALPEDEFGSQHPRQTVTAAWDSSPEARMPSSGFHGYVYTYTTYLNKEKNATSQIWDRSKHLIVLVYGSKYEKYLIWPNV